MVNNTYSPPPVLRGLVPEPQASARGASGGLLPAEGGAPVGEAFAAVLASISTKHAARHESAANVQPGETNTASAARPAASSGAPGAGATGESATDLEQAVRKFVGQVLYGQMLQSLRKAQDGAEYFHGGPAEEVFQNQLDQFIVDKLAASPGDRFARSLLEQQLQLLQR
jgi:hypothetical protein